MGRIDVENIRLYAYHGCLEEEGKIGTDYRVDISIWADLDTSAKTDKLKDTIDYVLLNKIAAEEMAIRSKLLEHVAQRIISRIMQQAPTVTKAKVKVSKLMPPINGDVESVGVTLVQKRVR